MATKPYLVYGRLLGPSNPKSLSPLSPKTDLDWDKDQHTGTVPAAEGRLWQDENGRLAVFLANYMDAPVEFKYRIDPAQFGLTGGSWELKEITPDGSKSAGHGEGRRGTGRSSGRARTQGD